MKKHTAYSVDTSKFHIVTPIINSQRFRARHETFEDFKGHIKHYTPNLHIVEAAFGERDHAHTEAEKRYDGHIRLRTDQEIWHKEAMINIGVRHLPPDWEYVAWVDGDIKFTNPDWFVETVQQLQHYQVVQMFSHAIDLGPQGEPIQTHAGFAYMYHQNRNSPPQGSGYGGYYADGNDFWHPGFAWAARREFFNAIGGLPEFAILGAADHHLALAFIGQANRSVPADIHPNYRREVMKLQDLSERYVRRDIGYVPGTLTHAFHGKKKDRKYIERWDILTKHQYDPYQDIRRDAQGLSILHEERIGLRDDIRAYFRQRNEDSIDLE